MTTEITTQWKDVAHLYIGCLVHRKEYNRTQPLTTSLLWHLEQDPNEQFYGYKPILRRLESMTEEEALHLASLSEYPDHFNDVKAEKNQFGDWIVTWQGIEESRNIFNSTGEMFYCSEQFQYLLKKGFDLFQLLDSGQAIEQESK